MVKICIDPGHGGRDPGAIGPTGLREADVTLRAALLLRSMLKARGNEVILTRSTAKALSDDKTSDLRMRSTLANKEKCDQFISIHCNSFADAEADGTETWYYAGSANGERLAKVVQESLVKVGQLADRGVKQTRSLAVLRYSSMPAILVELAFISNPTEEKLLKDGWWLSQVMSAVSYALTGGKADQATEEAELVRLYRLLDQVERDRVLALLVDMVESKSNNPA